MFSRYLLLGFLVSTTLSVTGWSARAAEITIKGSDTMVILNQKWAQEYMKKHPDVNIQVTGGGSGTGIAALRNNTTDIAAASRLIKPKEIQDFLVNSGIKPIQYKTCLDGVAVFVNSSNPLTEISLPTLGKIFRGEITNWKQVGGSDQPIVLYSRESNSGTYAFFKEEVLQEKDFSPRAQTLAGTAALIDAISKDTKGIGYGGIGYSHGVKALKLRRTESDVATAPSQENVEGGIYPLSRSLNFYLNPRSTDPEIEKFVKWVRSAEGQKIVASVGYYPLPGILPKPVAKAAPAPESKPAPVAEEKPAVTVAPAPTATGEMAAYAAPTAPAPVAPQPVAEVKVEAPAPVAAPTATASVTPATTSTTEALNALTGPVDPNAKQPVISTSLLNQFRTMIADREKSVMFREEAVAKREESIARRELTVAEREASLAAREEKLAQVTQANGIVNK
ncbi:MAG: hypothetical protein B9S32_17660 [Verrucomicrobia bacterium Tous-C9LFEB]|nr:MAG: hypothetical protein B9S32_17660 [Verrucomicrobia bacterium Tous-C9LFEB]